MSDQYIGEIRMFGGNYAPQDWAQCDGQTLQINQNDVLYSLIGTTFGGDGVTNFNLPDMRGRVPIHMGTGSGLTARVIGQSLGTENEILAPQGMPQHTHTMLANSAAGTAYNPTGNVLSAGVNTVQIYNTNTTTPSQMNAASLLSAGGGQGHTNLAPTLCVNFIIALTGYFPSRS
jgi:microcystin-dependent protein